MKDTNNYKDVMYEKGRQAEKLEITKNLLELDVNTNIIIKATGLTKRDILKITRTIKYSKLNN